MDVEWMLNALNAHKTYATAYRDPAPRSGILVANFAADAFG